MKQYIKLLLIREGKEVLGHRMSNLWLLTLVLVATFASIAFSEGSMIFLKDKMEDPFTNWVDIPIDGTSETNRAFLEELMTDSVQKHYNFTDVHGDRESYFDIVGEKDMYLRCRHVDNLKTRLVRQILDESNVVNGCVADSTKLLPVSLGLIVTADVIKHLGYSLDSIPAYLYYKAYVPEGDTLGLKLINKNYYPVPWPVLAVVRRLPGNVDLLGTNYLSEQPRNDNRYPFDFNSHLEYIERLIYFVPEEISDDVFLNVAREVLPDFLQDRVAIQNSRFQQIQTWKPGRQIELVYGQERVDLSTHEWIAFDNEIQERLKDQGLIRIYNYDTSRSYANDSYLSLTFNSLEYIRAFEQYAKSKGVQIDMSQVESKENFNAVAIIARILSSAMVVFSIVCIIMFLVNMLQNYFQKVQRNIGTFKAFGMNTAELISVYVIILVVIVCSAVIVSLFITWIAQMLLPIIGISRDGFSYLSLWHPMTYIAIFVILISTITTVYVVMSRMLKRTPGDLIYERE